MILQLLALHSTHPASLHYLLNVTGYKYPAHFWSTPHPRNREHKHGGLQRVWISARNEVLILLNLSLNITNLPWPCLPSWSSGLLSSVETIHADISALCRKALFPFMGCICCKVSGQMCGLSVRWTAVSLTGLQKEKDLAQGTFSVSLITLWRNVCLGRSPSAPRFNRLTMEHWAYSFKTRTLIWCYMLWCHSLLGGGISMLFFPMDVKRKRRTSVFQKTVTLC